MFTVLHAGREYMLGGLSSLRRESEISAAQELNFIAIKDDEFNPAFPYLLEESIVKCVDGHEYRIKKTSNKPMYRNVSAVHIVTDLTGVLFEQELDGSYTLQQIVQLLFANTGWTVNVNSSGIEPVTLSEWGNRNVWALFLDACKKFGAEFIVKPYKVIDVALQIGLDRGKQFRYGYNVNSITKNVDTTNLATRVKVKYGEKLNQVYEYISPNEPVYGRVIYAETISDEQIISATEAEQRAKQEIQDVPKLSYEIDAAELGEECVLGETVYTIYEPLDNLNITTRIIKFREEWNGEELVVTDTTVGNAVFATAEEELSDGLGEQKQKHKELDSIAVKQERLYNGVTITKEEGVKVERSDNAVTVWLNATEGIKIMKQGIQKFYVDTNGNVVFDGMLKITSNNGTTTMLEAFMDTLGGRVLINDLYGNLNVKIGSEESGSYNRGGIVKLYDDGEWNLRAELGAINTYNGNGALKLYDNNAIQRIAMVAFGGNFGGHLYINDQYGNTKTLLNDIEGYINNQRIATEPMVYNIVNNAGYATETYVQFAIAFALANYTPPSPTP